MLKNLPYKFVLPVNSWSILHVARFGLRSAIHPTYTLKFLHTHNPPPPNSSNLFSYAYLYNKVVIVFDIFTCDHVQFKKTWYWVVGL